MCVHVCMNACICLYVCHCMYPCNFFTIHSHINFTIEKKMHVFEKKNGTWILVYFSFCLSLSLTHAMHALVSVPHYPKAFFIGGGPQLTADSIVHSGTDRSRLHTTTSGVVLVTLGVIQRNFQRFGVEA